MAKKKKKQKSSARKKAAGVNKKSPAAKKRAPERRPKAKKKPAATNKPVRRGRAGLPPRYRDTVNFDVAEPASARGLGQDAAGQSGDTEGLSRRASAASESVEELVEEGQAFEAGIVSGVENAPDADQGEVTTREVPEDDVPEEYRNQD